MVYFFGAGGHGKVVFESYYPIPVRGDINWVDLNDSMQYLGKHQIKESDLMDSCGGIAGHQFHITFGSSLTRRQNLFESLKWQGGFPVTIIDPSAIVSESAKIGEGVFIGPGAIVNAYAEIGDNVILNTRAVVEHDAIVGDGCHIAPGAICLGGSKIRRCALVGANAVVLPGVKLRDKVVPAGGVAN